MDDNVQAQLEELEAIQSIFMEDFSELGKIPESVECYCSPIKFQLLVPLEIPENHIRVLLCEEFSDRIQGQLEVRFLPPVTLQVELPRSYPDEDIPLIYIKSTWLTKNIQTHLESELHKIMQNELGFPLIFSICNWIQYEALPFLIENNKSTITLQQSNFKQNETEAKSMEEIAEVLLNYDKRQKLMEFRNEIHCCDLCFDAKDGTEFEIFPCCGKGFCTDCVVDMCAMLIKNGTLELLKCPNCVQEFHPSFVNKFVSSELFERYDRLLLQKTLNSMNDIQYCPRCESVVIISDTLGRCTQCEYAFCSKCRGTFHQGTKCDELAAQLKGIKDQIEYDRERKSLEMIRKDSKRCPNCQFFVSRVSGCNKMTCTICDKCFCNICGSSITGYGHFRAGGCELFQQDRILAGIPATPKVPPKLSDGRSTISKPCPKCGQRSYKYYRNNDIKCWACNAHFCFTCNSAIKGTTHFATTHCIQHSD